MPTTLSAAVNAVRQQYQINPVQSIPAERVSLATPVRLYNGVEAVICGHSTADCQNYQVTWFDRRFWQQRFRWIARSKFEVLASNKTAIAA